MLVCQTLGEWTKLMKRDTAYIHTSPQFVEILELMPAAYITV